MPKYFDTKPGSLEEAVSAAQQAAIAISKKERGEKPKKENNFIYAAKMAKEKGEKTFTVGGKTYDVDEALENSRLKEYVETDGTKRRVKEGDNRLKANRAETNKNDKSLDEKVSYIAYKFKSERDAKAAKAYFDGIQLMGFDINDDDIRNGFMYVDAGSKDMTKYHKEVMKKFKPHVYAQETNKNDKSDDGDGLDAVQPKAVKKKFKDRKDKDIDNDGDVDDSDKFLHKRRKAISKSMSESIKSVAESVLAMWDEAAKKTESQDMAQDKDGDGIDDDGKAKKTKGKTDTGKEMTPIETSVKMPKTKNEKNKV